MAEVGQTQGESQGWEALRKVGTLPQRGCSSVYGRGRGPKSSGPAAVSHEAGADKEPGIAPRLGGAKGRRYRFRRPSRRRRPL